MEAFSEFIREEREEGMGDQNRRPQGGATGWESIVFQLDDDCRSDFTTEAAAPELVDPRELACRELTNLFES